MDEPQDIDVQMAKVREEVNLNRRARGGPKREAMKNTIGVTGAEPASIDLLLPLRGDSETETILARIREALSDPPDSATYGDLDAAVSSCSSASSIASAPDILLPRMRVPHQADLEIRDKYALSDFTPFHDAVFITMAYRGLLRRAPDGSGFDHYLGQLRGGHMGKVEILGRLRYSEEGRRRGVEVHGLLSRYIGRRVFRLPVVGGVVQSVYYMLRAPELARGLEQLQNHTEERGRLDAIQVNMAIEAAERSLKRMRESSRLAKAKSEADLRLLAKELRRELEDLRIRVEPGAGAPSDFYAPFEDRFRGDRTEIMDRVRVYIPLVQEANAGLPDRPILDLGCGRGEWLQVLSETGLHASGVDLNQTMVARSVALGLDVSAGDAIGTLRSLPEDSLGAVTAFHLIEHISFADLIALFDESLRCLRPGGFVLFETPNPENVMVGACSFYTDPTHRHPIPPEALRYIAEARGFVDARIHRLHPPNGEEEGMDRLPGRVRAAFLAPQDYSVMARKP